MFLGKYSEKSSMFNANLSDTPAIIGYSTAVPVTGSSTTFV
jgi:hypothetical protein